MNTVLENRIITLLSEERRIAPEAINLSSRLLEDLGMDGDDACDFFEKYQAEFKVDLTNIQWERHFGPEGFNPFIFFMPSFWKSRTTQCAVTVKDLIDSAHAGEWKFQYNDPTG